MATRTNNAVNNSVVDALEQLFQRSVIDPEFRNELLAHPEAFGISTDSEYLVLPTPVAKQDLSFVELVSDDTAFIAPQARRSTCISGYTIRCDGTTFE